MPRRGGGRSASPRASSPVRSARAPPTKSAVPPRPAGTQQAAGGPTAAAPQGPGLMGQMAATAGGVAIGSAMGHALGNMFSGRGGEQEVAAAQQQETLGGYEKQQQLQQPCEFEWRQFVECSQNQRDMSVCQSFNDLFKECKARYGQ